jgi:hypothetical protein
MEHLHSAADVLRGHPRYAAPERTIAAIRRLLDSPALEVVAPSTVAGTAIPPGAETCDAGR